MDLNDTLQWTALGATVALGSLGLYLQHQALKIAREDLAIARKQLELEERRHHANSEVELRKIELEAKKLAEKKAAREQKALGATLRWMMGE